MFNIGSEQSNDIVLAGTNTNHARIYIEENTVWVEDVSKGSGIFYNGLRLKSMEITENDTIYLGAVALDLSRCFVWHNGLPIHIKDPNDFDTEYQHLFAQYETYQQRRKALEQGNIIRSAITAIPHLGKFLGGREATEKQQKLRDLDDEWANIFVCPSCQKSLKIALLHCGSFDNFKRLGECPHQTPSKCGAKWLKS
jgi:pSer/pThr/pTyr-binding forkhead associated (FHA) protein